jgi:hypothetical protein
VIAWSVTLIALTAIRSPSVKSRSVWMRGSDDTRKIGELESGIIDFTFWAPRVRSHSVGAGPNPPMAISASPASSLPAGPLASRVSVTVTLPRPVAAACRSINPRSTAR